MNKAIRILLISTFCITICLTLGCKHPTTKNKNEVGKVKISSNSKRQNIIGRWTKIILPNGKLSKEMGGIHEIILELHDNGKGAIAFFEENGTDFPLTGTWDLKNSVLSITPDSMHNDTPKLELNIIKLSSTNITIDIKGVIIEMKRDDK